MAITTIHSIKTTMNKALEYIMNPLKTDNRILVSGYECTPQVAFYQFEQVRRQSTKSGGISGFHIIQSFSPGEVDYDTAHRIGNELAQKIFDGKFQYVVATHIDKGHVHNHIISNSVSFKDHRKFYSQRKTMYAIREESDRLCDENNLSVIIPKEKGKSRSEYAVERQGKSYKAQLRLEIDSAVLAARDWDEFLLIMRDRKYEIKQGKYISFRAEGQERFTRAKTLGERYTEENILSRIENKSAEIGNKPKAERNLLIDIENNFKAQQLKGYEDWAKKFNLQLIADTVNYLSEHNLMSLDSIDEKLSALREKRSSAHERIKEIEKRAKLLNEQINEIEVYHRTKPIVEAVPKHFGIEKYKKEHEADFILYTAAEKYLKKYFKGGKLPMMKTLRNEVSNLNAERGKLRAETQAAQKEMDELSTVRKNVTSFLELEKDMPKQKQKTRCGQLE